MGNIFFNIKQKKVQNFGKKSWKKVFGKYLNWLKNMDSNLKILEPALQTGLQKVGSRANFDHVGKQLAGQNVRTLCELCPNRKSVGMSKRDNFAI